MIDEWAKLTNLDTTFYNVMLRPALSVTLNEENTLSAAEMLMYSHYYFLSDSQVGIELSCQLEGPQYNVVYYDF